MLLLSAGWEQSGIPPWANVPLPSRDAESAIVRAAVPSAGQGPHQATRVQKPDMSLCGRMRNEDRRKSDSVLGSVGQQILARDPAAKLTSPGPQRHLAGSAGCLFPSGCGSR